jgi:hypothetical protein
MACENTEVLSTRRIGKWSSQNTLSGRDSSTRYGPTQRRRTGGLFVSYSPARTDDAELRDVS